MYDIVALGELLIDFTPCGLSENGMKIAELNPGGAVANVLCAASRMGKRTAFIGKVGDDAHGRYLRSKLIEYGVEPAGLVVSGEAPTTLAFVDIDEKGDRSFTFLRDPGADTLLRADELPEELLCSTRIFHVGSLSLTAEPSRSATLAAVRTAKESGALITYDPNYRALLWNSPDEAAAQMRSLLPYVDMIKISDNETMLLTDREAPEEALEYLMDIGIRCAVVTAGDKGAYVGVGGQICHVDLDDATDAYEASFVAVPAQPAAGVVKRYEEKEKALEQRSGPEESGHQNNQEQLEAEALQALEEKRFGGI